MNRSTFYGGPAYITHDSATYQAREGFEIDNEIRTVEQPDALRGKLGEREDYSLSMLRLAPHALTASLTTQFAKLFALQPANVGSLLFPGADLPLVVQTKNGGTNDAGQSLTFSAGAVSQPPELQFAPNKNLFGQAEWTCLRKNSTAATDTAAHVVVANSTYTEPALDPTNISNSIYVLAWGGGFTAIETDEEGVRAAVRYTWAERKTATDGLLNYQLSNVELEIRFRPVNVQANDIYDSLLLMDGASAGRGKFLSARGQALTVTGAAVGDPRLTVARATPVRIPTVFSDQPRSGEVMMRAQRHYTGGALSALFVLDVVPEP